jgi:hypothetical protein
MVKQKPYPGRESGNRVTGRVSRVKPEHGKFLTQARLALPLTSGWVSLVRGLTDLGQLGWVRPYPLTRIGLAFRF